MEHPDHTGESGNPRAPWNQPDADDQRICDACEHEPEKADGVDEGDTCLYDSDVFDPCPGHYQLKEN